MVFKATNKHIPIGVVYTDHWVKRNCLIDWPDHIRVQAIKAGALTLLNISLDASLFTVPPKRRILLARVKMNACLLTIKSVMPVLPTSPPFSIGKSDLAKRQSDSATASFIQAIESHQTSLAKLLASIGHAIEYQISFHHKSENHRAVWAHKTPDILQSLVMSHLSEISLSVLPNLRAWTQQPKKAPADVIVAIRQEDDDVLYQTLQSIDQDLKSQFRIIQQGPEVAWSLGVISPLPFVKPSSITDIEVQAALAITGHSDTELWIQPMCDNNFTTPFASQLLPDLQQQDLTTNEAEYQRERQSQPNAILQDNAA